MNIAIVTGAEYADLPAPERALIEALGKHGITCTPAVWTDPYVRWSSFDAALVRTPWDYHEKHTAFAAWLDRLDAENVRLVNPTATIRWNMHKRYLEDLKDRGVPLPKTEWLERGASAKIRLKGELVVKPAVSAGAFETFLTDSDALADATHRDFERFEALVSNRDVVVQEFCPAIGLGGELSFIFIDGKLTHAVVKHPASQDFRVQERFGGVAEQLDPSPQQIAAATRAVIAANALGHKTAYARVDMVEHEGTLRLMELELIEPSLYLEIVPSAVTAVADGLAKALHQT